MFTAMIAEDELLVRIGIASCVPWAEMGIRLVGETDDGLEAWKLYQQYRPDIVITDIRMPGMDGLDLVRNIRQEDSDCAVIFVTNVETDEAKKEAEALRVSAVLFKALMKKDDIRAAVERACVPLKEKDAPADTDDTEESRWYTIFHGDEKAALPFVPKGLVAVRVFPDPKLSNTVQRDIANLIVHRLEHPEAFCTAMKGNTMILLWRDSPEIAAPVSWLRELCRYVVDNFQLQLGIVAVYEPPADIRALVVKAVEILHDPRLLDDPVLCLDGQGNYLHERLNHLRMNVSRNLPLHENWQEMLRQKSMLEAYPGSLEQGFSRVAENAQALISAFDSRAAFVGLSAMTEWLCEKVETELRRDLAEIRPEVCETLDEIHSHLGEDLSFDRICAKAGFQASYFSRLFKSELHMSYSDYLFRARMLRALEMLEENDRLTVNEIAERCGFSETSYFSARFRQFTGMTPRQWREKR